MNAAPSSAEVNGGSRFWAVARLAWAGFTLVALVLELTHVTHHGTVFGMLGALTGLALLERSLVTEGRSPFFNRWRRTTPD